MSATARDARLGVSARAEPDKKPDYFLQRLRGKRPFPPHSETLVQQCKTIYLAALAAVVPGDATAFCPI